MPLRAIADNKTSYQGQSVALSFDDTVTSAPRTSFHIPTSNYSPKFGKTPATPEEVNLDEWLQGYDSSDSENNINPSETKMSKEAIQALIGSMTDEEYEAFVQGIKNYHQNELNSYTAMLEGNENEEGARQILERLKAEFAEEYHGQYQLINDIEAKLGEFYNRVDIEEYHISQAKYNTLSYVDKYNLMLDILYCEEQSKEYNNDIRQMSREEKLAALMENADFRETYQEMLNLKKTTDSMIETKFKDLGITSYEDLVQNIETLSIVVSQLEQAIKKKQEMIKSAEYDNLIFSRDFAEYNVYSPTKEDIEELKTFRTEILDDGDLNEKYIYDYDKYKESHPGVSPLAFAKMALEASNGERNFILSGVGDEEKLFELMETSEATDSYEKIYDYLYNKNGADSANDYIKNCQYEINNVIGQLRARDILDRLQTYEGNIEEFPEAILNELYIDLVGAAEGVGSFTSGIGYSFEALQTILGITEENRGMSIDEYEKMYILQALLPDEVKNEELKLIQLNPDTNEYENRDPNSIIDFTKSYTGGKLLEVGYEISQSIGNMLPNIALSAINPILGSATMGVSSGGNAYHQSMVEGNSLFGSIMYGVFTGCSESISEKLLGGLPGLSDTEVESLATYFQAAGKEGIQEMFQNVMDASYKAFYMGEQWETPDDLVDFLKETGKEGLYGAITAGFMQLPALAGTLKVNAEIKIAEEVANSVFGAENDNSLTEIKSAKKRDFDRLKEKTRAFFEGRIVDQNATRKLKYYEYKSDDLNAEFKREFYKRAFDLYKQSNGNISEEQLRAKLDSIFNNSNQVSMSQFDEIKSIIWVLCKNNSAMYQNILSKYFLPKTDPDYQRLVDKISKKLSGLNENEKVQIAQQILLSVNYGAGACSYAGICNLVADYYGENYQEFEKDFGFSMYKKDEAGNIITDPDTNNPIFNSAELILDLFINANSNKSGINKNNMFRINDDGSIEVDKFEYRPESIKKNMLYLTRPEAENVFLPKYFESKGINLEFEGTDMMIGSKKPEQIRDEIQNNLQKGKKMELYLSPKTGQGTDYVATDGSKVVNTNSWNEGGGHITYVLGCDDSGIYLASWGNEYFVSFDSLKESSFGLKLFSDRRN